MATYLLVGGPCDGQRSMNFTVRPFAGFTVLCQTHRYAFGADGRFHDAGIDPALTNPTGTAVLGASGPRGWHDLQHAVNTSVPTDVSRAKALTRAAHHKLAQRRRLR